MKNKVLKILTGLSTATLLGLSTVSLAGCARNQTFLTIIGEKNKKLNKNLLSLFQVKLNEPLDGGELSVQVDPKDRIEDLTLSCYGCSNPSGDGLISNILLKVKVDDNYTIHNGDKINFNLIVTNYKNQKIVWEALLSDLSITYDDTIPLRDANYNGWTDDIDPYDDDHVYKGRLINGNQCDIDFKMDYRTLINQDPTIYNPELAKLAVLLSASVGDKLAVTLQDEMFSDVNKLLKQIGCISCATYDLAQEGYDTDVKDTNAYSIGHHDVLFEDGKTYRVIFLTMRGTVTLDEIASDLDVGLAADEYFKFKNGPDGKITDHPDWITSLDDPNAKHTKSFCVAKNRIWKHLTGEKGYFKKHHINLEEGNNILFVSGHSRGASIANLISADLAKQKQEGNLKGVTKILSYCIAPPKTTQDSSFNDSMYNFIQNVHCYDDFVPTLPLAGWDFHVYGQEKMFKVSDTCEEEFSKKVSNEEGISLPFVCFSDALNLFSVDKMGYKTREDLYKFDDTHKYLTVEVEDMTQEDAIKSFIQRYGIEDCVKVEKAKTESGADCLHVTSIGGAVIRVADNLLSGQIPEGMSLEDLDIAQIILENSIDVINEVIADAFKVVFIYGDCYNTVSALYYMFTFNHLLPGYYFSIDHFK